MRGTRRPTVTVSAPSQAASSSSASRIPRPASALACVSAHDAVHGQNAAPTVEDRLDPADQLIRAEDRQHVVAVLPPRLRHEHLEPVPETEELLRAVAVVDQPVERGEKRDAIRDVAVVGLGMRLPAVRRRADAERAEAPLREHALGGAQGERLGLRKRSLGEIPEPLPAGAPCDRDLPAQVQRRQHEPDLPRSVPPVPLARPCRTILELARRERPAALELAEHVPAKHAVLREECVHPALGCVARRRAPAPHQAADDWEILDRPHERVPFEQQPLVPQQAVELRDVVAAEPAPEDEVLGRRDGRDGIKLQEAQVAHRLEDVRRRSVEKL